jgi:uncharacterized protein
MTFSIKAPALTLAVSALLAACGGGEIGPTGTPSVSLRDGRATALGATIPARKLPTCPAAQTSLVDITAVQGPGDTSPMQGARVTVRGIVTADFRSTGLGGLYLQQPDPDNDPATSEGLFVFTSDATALQPGDYVQVTGTVAEFRRGSAAETLTQLTGSPVLERCGAAQAIKPTTLTLPLKSARELEAVEGMLVRYQQPLYVSGNESLGRFGELVLSAQARLYHPNNHPTLTPDAARAYNALNRLVLDDTRSAQNPSPIPFLSAADSSGTRRAGDLVKGLLGIATYDFGVWRLQPTVEPAFESTNLRTPAPAPVGGTLKVSSLNVLNYFTTLGDRGANTSAELVRQRDKLVATIVALDADVLGLIEIQNNNGVALTDLVGAVNARLGAPVYAWTTAGVPGTDSIVQATVYKTATVRPVGNLQVPTDPDFSVDGGLRPPVAQRFAARANGGGFWFVVTHLKSKGGCPSGAGNPEADLGQGCWNVARTVQAQALVRWVSSLVAGSGEADVLMAGDFNAYLNEDPLNVLRSVGYEGLLGRLAAEDRYSYVFNDEAGALDHAFASPTLSMQVSGVAVWHTNADEPTVLDYNTEFKTDDRYASLPYRASDHDPVVVGLNLTADAPAAAATLTAQLPASAQATLPAQITFIVAQPTPGAANVALTVDWGDGTVKALLPGATDAEHAYAAAGRYRITVTLTQDGSLPAMLSAPITVAPAPLVERGLIISEYIEGSGFNKAIELYNPGNTTVDLANYALRLYSNGSPTPTASFMLSGALPPGATYVLCNSGIADPAKTSSCNVFANGVINFNGDDALTLERGGAIVDQFGQVGFDPGAAWTGGGVSTIDRTLRRKMAITQGSIPAPNPPSWDPSVEWDGFPNNTLDGLGVR